MTLKFWWSLHRLVAPFCVLLRCRASGTKKRGAVAEKFGVGVGRKRRELWPLAMDTLNLYLAAGSRAGSC